LSEKAVCADPEWPVHHTPRRGTEDERDEEYERAAEESRKKLADNQALLDSVLSKAPAVITRADHEMVIAAWLPSGLANRRPANQPMPGCQAGSSCRHIFVNSLGLCSVQIPF
jgi:hypothetical protein